MHRQTIPGREGYRLHRGQRILAQFWLILKEKGRTLLLTRVGIEGDWTIIYIKSNQPRAIRIIAADQRKIALVNVADTVKIEPNGLIQNRPFEAVTIESYGLHLISIRMDHHVAHIV